MSDELGMLVSVGFGAIVIANAWVAFSINEPPSIWYTLLVSIAGLLLILKAVGS